MIKKGMALACVLVAAGCASDGNKNALQNPIAPSTNTTMVAGALPPDTVIQVTPVQEITSIGMKVGDKETLQVVADVSQNGSVIIPRGAPVTGTISWRTGKGVGGKSAKFDLTFDTVNVRGTAYRLKGKHRQEGKGNTVAALLGSMVISGHSAVIESGQQLNAFTAEPIPPA